MKQTFTRELLFWKDRSLNHIKQFLELKIANSIHLIGARKVLQRINKFRNNIIHNWPFNIAREAIGMRSEAMISIDMRVIDIIEENLCEKNASKNYTSPWLGVIGGIWQLI